MGWQKVLSLLGLGAVALASVGQAEAITFNTFSSRASWIGSGVTVTGTENFNSILTDADLLIASLPSGVTLAQRGGFSLTPRVDVSPFNNAAAGINGTPILSARGIQNTGIITVTFPSAVSAVGFDWENFDSQGDDFRIRVGTDVVFDNASNWFDKGFLGIVSTNGTFTSLEIRKNPASLDPNGFGVFNAFDNFEFGTATPVPFEFNPAFGLIAFSTAFIIKKKFTKKTK
jgi:hypothetical protein